MHSSAILRMLIGDHLTWYARRSQSGSGGVGRRVGGCGNLRAELLEAGFGARVAYTLDGSAAGEIEDETFCGDGATVTGATATHAYAASGVYSVALTVRDTLGNQSVLTRDVTIHARSLDFADDFNRAPGAVGGWTVFSVLGGWTISADGRLIVSGGSYGTTNVWDVASGRHLVTLFTFVDSRDGRITDDWLAYHPDGFYDGSPGVERYLAWRVGDELKTPASKGVQLHRPDRIAAALQLRLAASDRPLLVPAPGSPIPVTDGGALVAGKINGDAFDDLLLLAGKRLSIFLGGSNRSWQKDPDVSVDLASGGSEMALADVNHDGVVNVRDLAFVSQQLPAGTVCP